MNRSKDPPWQPDPLARLRERAGVRDLSSTGAVLAKPLTQPLPQAGEGSVSDSVSDSEKKCDGRSKESRLATLWHHAARLLALLFRRHGAVLSLVAICAIAAIRYESFLTPENILNILRRNSMCGLMALGMGFTILVGGIDLSVGALLAVGGVVAAKLTSAGSVVAVLAAVAVATLLGLFNGAVIAKARIQPFVTTLAMGTAARGLALAATAEKSVQVDRLAVGFKWLGRGWVGPIPVPVLILAVAFFLGWVVLGHTRFGRHVYALGDNQEAARLLGLNVDRVTIAVYGVSGGLAGLAGVLLAARLGSGQPVAGMGWELDAIVSVVIGGTLLGGGQGGAGSTLVGVLLLGVIYNIFNLEGTLSSWWQWILRGLLLLLVVVIQNRLSRRS